MKRRGLLKGLIGSMTAAKLADTGQGIPYNGQALPTPQHFAIGNRPATECEQIPGLSAVSYPDYLRQLQGNTPDWLFKSARDAQQRYEESRWSPEPRHAMTPEDHRRRKQYRKMGQYFRRIRDNDISLIPTPTTVTAELKELRHQLQQLGIKS